MFSSFEREHSGTIAAAPATTNQQQQYGFTAVLSAAVCTVLRTRDKY